MGLSLGWGWRDRLARVGMNLGRGESGGGEESTLSPGSSVAKKHTARKRKRENEITKNEFYGNNALYDCSKYKHNHHYFFKSYYIDRHNTFRCRCTTRKHIYRKIDNCRTKIRK